MSEASASGSAGTPRGSAVLHRDASSQRSHGVGKADSTKKAYDTYRAQHQQLVGTGAIAVADGVGRLTRNVVFSSPSTAGAVALGRSCNGRREWISAQGTFGDWESRGVE